MGVACFHYFGGGSRRRAAAFQPGRDFRRGRGSTPEFSSLPLADTARCFGGLVFVALDCKPQTAAFCLAVFCATHYWDGGLAGGPWGALGGQPGGGNPVIWECISAAALAVCCGRDWSSAAV